MAKIEYAYCKELDDIITALEANEYYEFGIITDKRAFLCDTKGCPARITCKNMDTHIGYNKVIPHYIMSSRKNEHSPECPHYKEYDEKNEKRGLQKNSKISEAKMISFSFNKSARDKTIVHRENNTGTSLIEADDIKERKKGVNTDGRKMHLYRLSSLVAKYSMCLKNKTENIEIVEVDFGFGRKYPYTYGKLFRRISNSDLNILERKHHYVFWGKGIIKKTDKGYTIIYDDKFLNEECDVKCVIGIKELTDLDKKNRTIVDLEENSNKKVHIFLFARFNCAEKTVFLNIDGLEKIAILKYDICELDEEE